MFKHLICGLVACGFSASAVAGKGDSGFGLEGGVAIAELTDAVQSVASSFATATSRTVTYTYEESTVAGRMYGFYSVTDKLDIEIGYLTTGSMDAKYAFSGTTVTSTLGLDVSGFDYGVRYKPNDNWFVKLGLHSLDLTLAATVEISGTTFSGSSASTSETGAYLGGGYNFDEHWSVGYNLYKDVGGDGGGDLGFLFAGYRF